MNISTKLKKAAIGIAVAATAATGMLATTSGPAAASMGKGRVQLCSQGNYWSFLSFHGNGQTTGLVAPGACLKADIPVNTYAIEVLGKWNTSDATFGMGHFPATPYDDPGYKINTGGSTANGTAGWSLSRD